MTTIYKLTDQNMQTYGGTQWVLGEERTTDGRGEMCGPGWLHAYTDPLLAVLLNPLHANISEPRLFVGDGDIGAVDYGLKVGCTRMVLTEEITPLPVVTETQRIRFGILCAKQVVFGAGANSVWLRWPDAWLSGEDRTWESADRAVREIDNARSAAWLVLQSIQIDRMLSVAYYAAQSATQGGALAYSLSAVCAAVHAAPGPLNLPQIAMEAVHGE